MLILERQPNASNETIKAKLWSNQYNEERILRNPSFVDGIEHALAERELTEE